MTDLEHRLATEADRIHIDHGDVDMVVARGRARRARKTKVVSGVTALAVVAGVATLMNLGGHGSTPVATQQTLNKGDAGLHWEVQSTTDGLGMSGPGINGSGPYYALSTAPGTADYGKAQSSRVVWRSDDGIEWTAASTLGQGLYLSDLSPVDGRVYAVGTAPAQANTKRRSDLVAGWSDDGGKTFAKQSLPIDWAGIEAQSTKVTVWNTQVASTAKGTFIVANVQTALDVPRLLPSGVTAPDGWATTATGVDILGPEKTDGSYCPPGTTDKRDVATAKGRRIDVKEQRESQLPRSREVEPGWCHSTDDPNGGGVSVSPQDMRGVVRSVTWADLGVSGDSQDAASKHLFGFFAPAGSTEFTRVDMGDARTDAAFLDADEGGFNVFATGTTYASSPASSTDMHSVDGKTWTAQAGPADLNWITAAGTVNGVRTVVGDSQSGSTVIARFNGSSGWVETPLESVLDVDGKPVHTLAAGVGGLGIVVAVMPDAKDAATAQTLLAFSRDGATWESHPAENLAKHSVGVPLRIFVTGQRAVVAFSGGSHADGEPIKPQTILVATPA